MPHTPISTTPTAGPRGEFGAEAGWHGKAAGNGADALRNHDLWG